MSEAAMKLLRTEDLLTGSHSWWWWCRACKKSHSFTDLWAFNGDAEAPTFEPALGSVWVEDGKRHCCKVNLRAGILEYLDGSTHARAGTRLPLGDLSEGVEYRARLNSRESS